jgi:RNA polymerase sigma-70 factor (ECF subfamily)
MSDKAISIRYLPESVAAARLSDEMLVSRCHEELPDVTDAFDVLVRRYERRIYHWCRRYLGDEAEAKEAQQEVLVRLFRGLQGFAGRASFRMWLYRVVQNQCHTQAARRLRRNAIEDLAAGFSEAPVSSVAEAIEEAEAVTKAQEALTRLSFGDREILALRFFREYSIEDIARTLDLRLSAAKMRLYRAQDRFRRVYLAVQG